MIPDFVQQILEVQRRLAVQAGLTAESWRDCVRQSYYEEYVERYEADVEDILYGRNVLGKGLGELLVFFDEKEGEMASLTGRK